MPIKSDSQSKMGKASAQMYLWFIHVGDCRITSAMKDGGITKIHHVDTEISSFLFGMYGRLTIVVYGE
jgi:hypothetical protein